MGVHAGVRGGRCRLAGLLASSSVAALLMGSGGPAAAACYSGPFTGGYSNSGAVSPYRYQQHVVHRQSEQYRHDLPEFASGHAGTGTLKYAW